MERNEYDREILLRADEGMLREYVGMRYDFPNFNSPLDKATRDVLFKVQAAFRELAAEMGADDAPIWHEGGIAYEASKAVREQLSLLDRLARAGGRQ